jgi:hypothetical protein
MPRRYGKKTKYSKKRRYRGKRKSKFGKRRKRYGRKGSKKMYRLLKDSKLYSTIYKTACRCVSRPASCQWYVLAPDQYKAQWNNGNADQSAMTGDMTWRGNRDKGEAMTGVINDANPSAYLPWTVNNLTQISYQLQSNNLVQSAVNTPAASVTNNLLYQDETKLPALELSKAWPMTMNPNFSYIYGKNKYQMFIKSAVTGGNVNIKLVKCVARYDIPHNSGNANARKSFAQSIFGNSSTQTMQMLDELVTTANKEGLLDSLVSWWMLGWNMAFPKGGNVTSDTPGVQNATAVPFNFTINNDAARQEGSTIYDNKLWCRLFKIQKSYNQELLPGQQAMIKMKQKMQMLNTVRDSLGENYLVKKGQIVFCLQVQGAIGHTPGIDGGDESKDTFGDSRFFGGASSRPGIGLMAAAVDVMCWKRFNIRVAPKKVGKVKNIITYNDYADDWTALNQRKLYNINAFIDSAPSDYAATHAAIN